MDRLLPRIQITLLFLSLYIIITAHSLLSNFKADAYRVGGNNDQQALLEFKAKIVDPTSSLSSWNTSIHFCRWKGITCGVRHRRVTVLDLESHNLAGTITPHVGNLSFLRVFNLIDNSLYSSIPPEVGRLLRLRYLFLNNNSLSGQIPSSLSRCSNLISINLRVNRLEGELPSDIGSLSKLRRLQLEYNNLIGSIPPSFGNLSSLEVFTVLRNNLSGQIPDTIGKLRNLLVLSFANNNFAGTIPSSIYNISSIVVLDLSQNQLVGRLPGDLGYAFQSLTFIGASANNFTGPIPQSISNVSSLTYVGFGQNNFTGPVPSFQKMIKLNWLTIGDNNMGSQHYDDLAFLCSLTNSTDLENIEIQYNNFRGVLPECIANLSTTLGSLRLEYNSISGTLPGGIGNLVNLRRLLTQGNGLYGNLPAEIGNLKQLDLLNLARNSFSGKIPNSFLNLTMLTELALYSNSLQGDIPSSLSHCRDLILLDLSDNSLQGVIPRDIMLLSSLSIYADFSRNKLSGEIPLEVGNLTNIGALSFAGNNFSGEIPSTIGSCEKLEALDIQDNLFSGSIPSTLRSLRGIQELNLSNNRLSGQVPEFLEELPLEILDLSQNLFEGALPTRGIFANASAVSIFGNAKLCGGRVEFQLPKCSEPARSRKNTQARIIVIGTVSGFIGLMALALSLLAFYWRRNVSKEAAPMIPRNGILNISYQSLLKASDGFSTSNLIGVGSFGSVYKGVLDRDQTVVAIKVLNLQVRGALKSFISECEALRNIRHRNLVKVLTACSGIDYQGNDFKALVYEFMANGSLEEWLHSRTRESNQDPEEEPRHLSLLQRLNIAIDVACAVEYLHHQCETPIVHCDLKPNNVLLDEDMTARVGDFGLVRFAPEVAHELIMDSTSSNGVKGSLGYIAPEYGAGAVVSTKGDIYSYGILVLEMFTGKRPTDETFGDGQSLHACAKAALPGQVHNIIDPILVHEARGPEDARNYMTTAEINDRFCKVHECLASIIEVGVICSNEVPRERMDIGDVVSSLHAIEKKLIVTRH